MTPESVTLSVRDYCVNRLLDTTDGFNASIAMVAPTVGAKPFSLAITGNPPTLFRGRYDLPTLGRVVGNNVGTYCLISIAKMLGIGRDNMKVTPSAFSGVVPVTIDFYSVINSGSIPPDGEALWFALEAAMIATFNGGDSPVPFNVSYNNEMNGEQGNMEWASTVWTQVNSFTLLFNKITNG